jgi:hypothetical protein
MAWGYWFDLAGDKINKDRLKKIVVRLRDKS